MGLGKLKIGVWGWDGAGLRLYAYRTEKIMRGKCRQTGNHNQLVTIVNLKSESTQSETILKAQDD